MSARTDGQGRYATSARLATRASSVRRCAIIRRVAMSKGVVQRMAAARVTWSMQVRVAWSARSGFMAGHATCFVFGTTRARVKGSAQETVHAHASNGRRGDLARAVGPGTLVMDVVLCAMHL